MAPDVDDGYTVSLHREDLPCVLTAVRDGELWSPVSEVEQYLEPIHATDFAAFSAPHVRARPDVIYPFVPDCFRN